VLSNDEKQLTTEITALVLERIAPEELVFLSETAQDYFANPQAVLHPPHRDEPLGFDVDIALITPYVLAVAGPTVQYVVSVIMDGVRDAATAEVSDRVRSRFRRSTSTPVEGQVALTPDQARTIHEITERQARTLGLPDDQARILADALVASLITQA
jgi:hypothetical protein